jgi:outer membrane protein assembly factor BamA
MKLSIKLIIVFIFVFFAEKVIAQQNKQVPIKKIPVKPKKATEKDSVKKDTIVNIRKTEKQVDVSDLLEALLNIKPGPTVDSVTSKPTFSLVPAVGYTLVSKFAVVLSGNAAFRTGPKSRISTIVASTSFTQNRQFTLPIQSSIWSRDNEYNFVGDFRFYQYPQSTFGLGSNSNIHHEDPMDYDYVQIYETILRHITGNLYAGAGYIIDNHWNITDKGYYNDYSSYGKSPSSIASGFTLNAVLDSRDNAINPSKGVYSSLQYRDNYRFLGSTSSWQSLVVDIRRYINLPQGSDNVLALWSYDWLILSGKPGFLDLPSTQWDAFSATGRGYIQGRFRGAQMVYAESEYRYKITENGLVGGVFFLNAESFSAAPGTRLQGIQPGFGPGLRVKLNKVSKTNICIDYGFGRQGSNGLFIDVGEIF